MTLFRYLERVTWTSRSGGQIIGNDEYNRDSCEAGGGGNYVVREYSTKHNQATRLTGARAQWVLR